MSLPTGTLTRYASSGLRESLHDSIYDISPMQTPFTSSVKHKKGKQHLEEWLTDSLAAVDTTNAQLDGDDFTYTTPADVTRVGNYMQILRKTAVVSDSLEDVDKAGRDSQMAHEIVKRGKEIKRDFEAICLINQAGDAGGVGTARKLAALPAWIKTNDDIATNGGSAVYTAGVPGTRTDGAGTRAFTETIGKTVMQSCYTAGAEPTVLMCGPVNKVKASAFAGIATRNFDLSNVKPQPTAIIGAADVWVTDFGTLRIIPNRFQRERDAFFLDWEMIEILALRPLRDVKIAKTGDNTKRGLVMEATLKVKNEAGLGMAADLTTTA
jgi:hypothetical protein